MPSQVTIVEKADSSSVLPSPLSISTKSKMTFLFANLKDRDFLVQRISDFLQKMPSKQPGGSGVGRKASTVEPAPEVRGPLGSREVGIGARARASMLESDLMVPVVASGGEGTLWVQDGEPNLAPIPVSQPHTA